MTDHSVELHDYQPTVPKVYIALAWLWVAIPFAYGAFELVLKVKQLFQWPTLVARLRADPCAARQ